MYSIPEKSSLYIPPLHTTMYMPAYSVYCSNKESNILTEKGISPSKAFSLGILMYSEGGALEMKNNIQTLKVTVRKLQEDLDMKDISFSELTQKYAKKETERERLVDALIQRGLTLEECKKIYMGGI